MKQSKTTLRIQKAISRGCSNERIAAILGRPLDEELKNRIDKLRANPQ